MCTAISMTTQEHYFGRNLDVDCSYGEKVCVMPRRFSFEFRGISGFSRHYAIIGMAAVVSGVPLLFDGVNEYGLSMAGLNFPNNACYAPFDNSKVNITPFEFIPYILARCKTVDEAEKLLQNISLLDVSFNSSLPLSPLHWIIDDRNHTIVVEQTKDGLHIYDNPVHVLTNNPPFLYQLSNLEKYKDLRTDNEGITVDDAFYCQGLGAVGLPGDASSMSRFVRAAFLLKNSACDTEELFSVGQFFHILQSVEMVSGITVTDNGKFDITSYSACINADKGLYYYTTYDNREICCVDMHTSDLEGDKLIGYPLRAKQNIYYQKTEIEA